MKQPLKHRKPQLPWKFTEYLEWVLKVPIETTRGKGDYEIHLTPRPGYCDRGDWLLHLERHGAHDIDGADGFPRYFFGSDDEAKVQMERWLERREAFRVANERALELIQLGL